MIDLSPVLNSYPPEIAAAAWVPLGDGGGFSGSCIWRGTSQDGRRFALKRYPQSTNAEDLRRIHRWMAVALASDLGYVPNVETCLNHETVAIGSNRFWDITSWMSGNADFHDQPSDARLLAAIDALARIHLVWSSRVAPVVRYCPAIQRRWRAIQDAETVLASESSNSSLLVTQARCSLRNQLPRMRSLLSPWRTQRVAVQPCLIDVWHDHVLFDGDSVTGLIDFAAARVDSPCADLARLLGSLIPGEQSRTQAALKAYATLCPLPNPELVEILDLSGVFGAVTNWLMRFQNEEAASNPRILARFELLVNRLANM